MSDDLDSLRERIRQFVRERDWEQFHDAKNLAMCLASEVGELIAELRWIPNSEVASALDDPVRKARIEAELGDILISVVMLADAVQADLVGLGLAKLLSNAAKYPVGETKGLPDPAPHPATRTG